MEQNIFCLIGLGNPGQDYKATRHNIGFRTADYIAEKFNLDFSTYKNIVSFAVCEQSRYKLVIAKPLTFMNNSGNAASHLSARFGITAESFLVVYDDFDLPFGRIRIRPSGSPGGHNGLKSLVSSLNTENIKRVRVGIGYPENAAKKADYVLNRFSGQEEKMLDKIIPAVADCALNIFSDGIDACMNMYNAKDFSNE